jgi:uncharacterized membrane protein YjdF
MNKKLFSLYLPFLLIYIIFAFFSFSNGKTWFYDGLFAVALISVLYFLSSKLKLGKTEFILANLGIIVHLLGFFGAYELTAKIIQYDNFVHIFNGFVVAWIVFNLDAHTVEKKLLSKHKVFLFFIVITAAVALSLVIELTEYAGFLINGEGEGLFFVGSGDANGPVYGNYADAMDDTVSNIIGAVIGSFAYYLLRYKKTI